MRRRTTQKDESHPHATVLSLGRLRAHRLPALEHLRGSSSWGVSAGGAGDEGRHDVGGVPVERYPSSVVAHCRPRVGVTCGFLDVSEWDAGVERGGDERVAQRVGSDALGDFGSAGDASADPGCGVTVEALTVGAEEEWPFAAFADREIDRTCGTRRERDDHGLGAFTQDRENAVASLETERLDVRPGRFRNAKSIECQQAEERMILRASESGGDEHGTDFVAVESGGV